MIKCIWLILCVGVGWGSSLAAQETDRATPLARAILAAVLEQSETIRAETDRSGRVLVDSVTFSRVFVAAVGRGIDAKELVAAPFAPSSASDVATAIKCSEPPPTASCWVVGEGIFVSLESLRVDDEDASAVVRYQFGVRRGPGKIYRNLGFVQLRLEFELSGSEWRLIRRETTLRS